MPIAYSKIIYATDFTKNCEQVLQHALEIARKFKATIDIVNVMPKLQPEVLHYLTDTECDADFEKAQADYQAKSTAAVKKMAREFIKCKTGLDVETEQHLGDIEVLYGEPSAMILQRAAEFNADLIVIGKHGKGVLELALFGSHAEEMIRKVRIPILIVPHQ